MIGVFIWIVIKALENTYLELGNSWLIDVLILFLFDNIVFENLKNLVKVCFYLNDLGKDYKKSATDTLFYKILNDVVFEDFL